MTVLMDSSVLIGLAVDDHEHHERAADWFTAHRSLFATCPVTEGALVRHIVRNGRSAHAATTFLDSLRMDARHEFWADDLSYADLPSEGMVGHRQVTDAYLAQLTRLRGARLVTFDRALASNHSDVADLVAAR